jgi:hypothetical protein
MIVPRRVLLIALCLLPVTLLGGTQFYAPPQGCAFSASVRAFDRLKNRTTLPRGTDFDPRVTLAALIEPGDDHKRWSEERAAVVEGYVVDVYAGGPESANCFSYLRRDTHIEIALRPDAPPRERVIAEVTPPARDLAAARGLDWSSATLRQTLVGHRCRFEGWLLFDDRHAGESGNTQPSRRQDWRATAWELHPVTDMRILD